MPGARHRGRILALQLLYQTEISGEPDRETTERFWSGGGASRRARAFAVALYSTVRAHQEGIDALISTHLEHWKLHRLSVMVRCVLRLGVAEMVHLRETAAAVVIDEAISLAREYVDDEAARFVNGVLDPIHRSTLAPGDSPLESPPSAG